MHLLIYHPESEEQVY